MRVEGSRNHKSRHISKLASKVYSPEKIAEKARTGYHGDETMEQVFKNIIYDPHVTIENPDAKGNSVILYDGVDIGWMNIERGMGWIDDKAYDKLQKYVEPEEPLASIYDEDDEDYDDYEDIEDDEEPYLDDDVDASTKVTADIDVDSGSKSLDKFFKKLESVLSDASVMEETVDTIYAADGSLEEDVFIDSETFFDLMANDEPETIALKFFNGEDMDAKGPANPSRDYFRYNAYENVESTDDPGSIYKDEIMDEVCDYIHDNPDLDYPDKVTEVIDKYLVEEDK